MGDVHENVDVTVEGAGSLRDAAAAAEALDVALKEDRDAAIEAAAAMDAMKASSAGATAQTRQARDEMGRFAKSTADLDAIAKGAQARMGAAGGILGGPSKSDIADAERAARQVAQIQKDMRSASLVGGSAGVTGRGALDQYASDLEKLKADLAGAEPQIDSMNEAIGRSARDSGIAAHALGNWHGALSDVGSGGDINTAITSSKELDGALSDMRRSGDGAARALGDLTGGPGGGGPGKDLEGLAEDGEKAAFSFGQLGESLSGGLSGIGGAGMPALITGIAAAASTIGPVLLSAGAGAAAFGALAVPAFSKVKAGLTNVTTAQAAYRQAAALEKVDPTKANLAAQEKSLERLKATWAAMPKPVASAVKAVQGFGKAWSQASQKSGIQQDFLKDIPKAVKDVEGLIPATTKLAKGFAPVISGVLSGFGKFEKSSGFKTFISNIDSEIPGATRSLGKLGNAVGGLVTDLTSPKNMQAGNKLLDSVSGLLKTSSPGAVSGLDKVAGAITNINKALSSAQTKKSGANESALNLLLGAGGAVGKFLGQAGSGAGQAAKDATGFLQRYINAPIGRFLNSKGAPYIPGQGIADPSKFGASARQDAAAYMKQYQHAIQSEGKTKLTGGAQSFKLFANEAKGAQKAGQDAGKAYATGLKSGVQNAGKQAGDAAKSIQKPLAQAGHEAAKDGQKAGKDYGQAVAKSVKSAQPQITQAASQAVKQAMRKASQAVQQSGLKNIGQDIAKDFSGVKSAASQAMSGLDSAVSAGASKAAASVSRMASGMKAAIAGLPGVFNSIGAAAGAGMASGIEASTGAAVAAAASMAAQVEAAARVTLQTQSPSRKFRAIGVNVIEGFILGVEGGKSAVQTAMRLVLGNPFQDAAIKSAITKLKLDVQHAFSEELASGKGTVSGLEKQLGGLKKGSKEYAKIKKELGGKLEFKPITKQQETQLTQLIDTDNTKLMKLAKQRQTLVSQIKAADALAASVQQAAVAGADITGSAGNTQAGQQQANIAQGALGTQQNPYQDIQQGLGDQLKQVRQFKGDITKLKKEGLDKQSIKQLLNAGVSGGLPVAEQILAEGQGGVKAIAQLQNEIGKASKQLGITGANAAYENASDIGRGLAAGLKDSLKGINKVMGNIAKDLVTSLMTALGASSKDIKAALKKLDKELGIGGGAGGGSGGGSATGPGHNTPPHIIYRPPPPRQPGPIQTGGGGGQMRPASVSIPPIIVNVQVDGKTIARTVQTAAMQHARRNPSTYPNIPGRAAA